jgi:pellino protein
MHPSNGFDLASDDQPEWMEVSVCGQVFKLNESRLTPDFKLNNIKQNDTDLNNLKTNILRDGTLIDLCGATLLWRSVDSLKKTFNKHCLEMNLENLNRLKLQCPVGLKTLVFPSSSQLNNSSNRHLNHINNNILSKSNAKIIDRTPMVYLKCGHVHGHHNWGKVNENERECPLCRKVSYIFISVNQSGFKKVLNLLLGWTVCSAYYRFGV